MDVLTFYFRALPLVASQLVNDRQAIQRDLLPSDSRHRLQKVRCYDLNRT
jgi:hypothetical protein